MAWRVARSLEALRDQVNAAFPGRDKSNDGTIGDARHQAEKSEHNPDANGVVRAMDISNDPAHGLVVRQLAKALVASRDERILYLISNRQIISSSKVPWVWRPYGGINAHEHHMHISVVESPALYDDTRPWAAVKAMDTSASSPPVVTVLMDDAEARFDRCLPLILAEEGGNDDDPRDSGGRTSRGIIQREYDTWRTSRGLPTRDVWRAGDDEVRTIYHDEYWLPRCPKLHPGVDLSYFNIGVNAGLGRAEQILMASIGGTDAETVDRFNDAVVAYYRGRPKFPIYGRGWLARSARIHTAAAKMVSAAPQPQPKVKPVVTTTTTMPVDQIEALVENVLERFGSIAVKFVPAGPGKDLLNQVLDRLPDIELELKLESVREHITDPAARAAALGQIARNWADKINPPGTAAVGGTAAS